MTDKYNLDNILIDTLEEEQSGYITEADFYPPSDNRFLKSYVNDIYGGDNFADYCSDFFKLCDEEYYYD